MSTKDRLKLQSPPPTPLKPPSSSPEGEGGHPDGNAKVNAKDNAYVSDNAKANANANVSLFPNSLFHHYEKLLAINQVDAFFVTLWMFEEFGSHFAIRAIGVDVVLGMHTWQLLRHHVVVSECVEQYLMIVFWCRKESVFEW